MSLNTSHAWLLNVYIVWINCDFYRFYVDVYIHVIRSIDWNSCLITIVLWLQITVKHVNDSEYDVSTYTKRESTGIDWSERTTEMLQSSNSTDNESDKCREGTTTKNYKQNKQFLIETSECNLSIVRFGSCVCVSCVPVHKFVSVFLSFRIKYAWNYFAISPIFHFQSDAAAAAYSLSRVDFGGRHSGQLFIVLFIAVAVFIVYSERCVKFFYDNGNEIKS